LVGTKSKKNKNVAITKKNIKEIGKKTFQPKNIK